MRYIKAGLGETFKVLALTVAVGAAIIAVVLVPAGIVALFDAGLVVEGVIALVVVVALCIGTISYNFGKDKLDG